MNKLRELLYRLTLRLTTEILLVFKGELVHYLDDELEEIANVFHEALTHHTDDTHRRFGDSIQELKQGYARLEPDESIVLFTTDEAGKLGGIIDFSEIGGPTSTRVEMFFYVPNDKTGENVLRRMRSTVVKRESGDQDVWSPIMSIFETYSPYGGEIRLTQLGGISSKYYYNVFRRA